MSETSRDGDVNLPKDDEGDISRIIDTKNPHLRNELDILCREPPLSESDERDAVRALVDLRTELWGKIRSYPDIEGVLAELPPLVLPEVPDIPIAVTVYRRVKERQKNAGDEGESATMFTSLHEAYTDYMNRREKFAMSNGRLVVTIAQQFQGFGDSLNDLIHSGMEGLYYAVDHFNVRKDDGHRFSTYAWPCIRGSTLTSLDSSRTIRLRSSVISDILALNRAEAELRLSRRDCGPEELLKKLGWSDLGKVKLLLKARKKPQSIDSKYSGDDEGTSMVAFIEGNEAQPGIAMEARDEVVKARKLIEEAVDRLMNEKRSPHLQKKLQRALPLWLEWRQLHPAISRIKNIADHHSLRKGKVKEICGMFQRQMERVLREMAAERERASE